MTQVRRVNFIQKTQGKLYSENTVNDEVHFEREREKERRFIDNQEMTEGR